MRARWGRGCCRISMVFVIVSVVKSGDDVSALKHLKIATRLYDFGGNLKNY